MTFRNAGGKKIVVTKRVITCRSVMRSHLRDAGMMVKDLAPIWDITPDSVHRRFYDNQRAMTVQYVEAFIEALKLDDFDALELRRLGAMGQGWRIDEGNTLTKKGR